MKQRVIILGSTGSIGTQALEVVAEHPERFEVVGIAAAGRQPEVVIQQARQFDLAPDCVAVVSNAEVIEDALDGTVISGPLAAAELVRNVAADTVLNALVGSLGIHATMAALEVGARLALANKESLVAGGQLVLDAAAPGQLIPVDSEHSAMAQCLRAGTEVEVAKLVLTASGGPFRGWDRQQMWEVTPQQAAAHPTWSMGQMNTLNSATLVNKGLELIEASLLFGIPADRIAVTVHPQSIVHSMVTFIDGCTIAQASPPSMKLPIALALDWPHRLPEVQPALDFTQSFAWEFAPVDDSAFPAVGLAREVVTRGGTWPAVYNAANEEAAEAFLQGRIRFPQIVDTVAAVLDVADAFAGVPSGINDVLSCEHEARACAHNVLEGFL